jgi:hypothetical protein
MLFALRRALTAYWLLRRALPPETSRALHRSGLRLAAGAGALLLVPLAAASLAATVLVAVFDGPWQIPLAVGLALAVAAGSTLVWLRSALRTSMRRLR